MVFARSAVLLASLLLLASTPRDAGAFRVEQVVATTCAGTSTSLDYEFGCLPPASTVAYVPGSEPVPADPTALATSVRAASGSSQNLRGPASVSAYALRDGDALPLDELAAGSTSTLAITIGSTLPTPEPVDISFELASGELALVLKRFVSANDHIPITEVGVSITCVGCGPSGLLWSYQAQFASYNSENPIGLNDLLDSFDPQAIGKPSWDVDTSVVGAAYASIAAPFKPPTLSLGLLQPEATMVVTFLLRARTYTGEFEPFGQPVPPSPNDPEVELSAWLEDPFGLPSQSTPPPFATDSIYINGTGLSVLVPEPAPNLTGVVVLLALVSRLRQRRA